MYVDTVQLGPTAGGTETSQIVLFLPWSENLFFPVIQQSTKQRLEYYRQTTIICLLNSFEKARFTVYTRRKRCATYRPMQRKVKTKRNCVVY